MKSFIKKFSFVLAAAMVLTSVAVPASAEAATKGEVTVKGSAVSSKTVWAGGKSVNFDYKYGKKTSGIKGVWTSNNANIVVNPTSGKVTATGKADGTVTFTPDSKKYKKITVAVKARVRATGLFVREDDKNGQVVSEASVKVGETKKFYVSMSTKLHVKSTYFTHVSASTTAASVSNGANGTSYKGANYGRTLTVTGLEDGVSVINVAATPYTDDRTSNYDPTPVTLTVNVGKAAKIDNAFEQGAKQTGARRFTVSGLSTTAGLTLVPNQTFNVQLRTKLVSDTVNADGTHTAVFESYKKLGNNRYSLYYKDGKVAAQFVAEAERPENAEIEDTLTVVSVEKKVIHDGGVGQGVGRIKVTNQWGEAYDAIDANNGHVDVYVENIGDKTTGEYKATVEYAHDSAFSTNKYEKGVYYYTVNGRVFKDRVMQTLAIGDTKKVSVAAYDYQNNKIVTASKFITVNAAKEVKDIEYHDLGFVNVTGKGFISGEGVLDRRITDELTEKYVDANNTAYAFYVAHPKDKKASLDANEFTAYIDNGATPLAVTRIKNAELNAFNGRNGNNSEDVYVVSLKDVAVKAGKHTLTIVRDKKRASDRTNVISTSTDFTVLASDELVKEPAETTATYTGAIDNSNKVKSNVPGAVIGVGDTINVNGQDGTNFVITNAANGLKVTSASLKGYTSQINAAGNEVKFTVNDKSIADATGINPNGILTYEFVLTAADDITVTKTATATPKETKQIVSLATAKAGITNNATTIVTYVDENGNALFTLAPGETGSIAKAFNFKGDADVSENDNNSNDEAKIPEGAWSTSTMKITDANNNVLTPTKPENKEGTKDSAKTIYKFVSGSHELEVTVEKNVTNDGKPAVEAVTVTIDAIKSGADIYAYDSGAKTWKKVTSAVEENVVTIDGKKVETNDLKNKEMYSVVEPNDDVDAVDVTDDDIKNGKKVYAYNSEAGTWDEKTLVVEENVVTIDGNKVKTGDLKNKEMYSVGKPEAAVAEKAYYFVSSKLIK